MFILNFAALTIIWISRPQFGDSWSLGRSHQGIFSYWSLSGLCPLPVQPPQPRWEKIWTDKNVCAHQSRPQLWPCTQSNELNKQRMNQWTLVKDKKVQRSALYSKDNNNIIYKLLPTCVFTKQKIWIYTHIMRICYVATVLDDGLLLDIQHTIWQKPRFHWMARLNSTPLAFGTRYLSRFVFLLQTVPPQCRRDS